jgi:hypothetical protein
MLAELDELGVTRAARERDWTHVCRGVYIEGSQPPTRLEHVLAVVLATGGVASGRVGGVLHGLDSVTLEGPDVTVPPGSSTERQRVRR